MRGKLSAVLAALGDGEIKGEIVIMVQGSSGDALVSEAELRATISRLAGDGMGVKEISELLGERYGVSKKEIYKLALELKSVKRGE